MESADAVTVSAQAAEKVSIITEAATRGSKDVVAAAFTATTATGVAVAGSHFHWSSGRAITARQAMCTGATTSSLRKVEQPMALPSTTCLSQSAASGIPMIR